MSNFGDVTFRHWRLSDIHGLTYVSLFTLLSDIENSFQRICLTWTRTRLTTYFLTLNPCYGSHFSDPMLVLQLACLFHKCIFLFHGRKGDTLCSVKNTNLFHESQHNVIHEPKYRYIETISKYILF